MLPAGLLLLGPGGRAPVSSRRTALASSAFRVSDGLRRGPAARPRRCGWGVSRASTASNLTSPPYTISNYPPVYPLVLSPLGRLWGPRILVRAPALVAQHRCRGGLRRPHPPRLHARPRGRSDRWPLAVGLSAGLVLVGSLSRGRIGARAEPRWGLRHGAGSGGAADGTGGGTLADRRDLYPAVVRAGRAARGLSLAGPSRLVASGLRAGRPHRRTGSHRLRGTRSGDRGGFAFNVVSANLNDYQAGSVVQYLTDVWTLMPLTLIAVRSVPAVGALVAAAVLAPGRSLCPRCRRIRVDHRQGGLERELSDRARGGGEPGHRGSARLATTPPGSPRRDRTVARARHGPGGPRLAVPYGHPHPSKAG